VLLFGAWIFLVLQPLAFGSPTFAEDDLTMDVDLGLEGGGQTTSAARHTRAESEGLEDGWMDDPWMNGWMDYPMKIVIYQFIMDG